jgi:hypothetical protein
VRTYNRTLVESNPSIVRLNVQGTSNRTFGVLGAADVRLSVPTGSSPIWRLVSTGS